MRSVAMFGLTPAVLIGTAPAQADDWTGFFLGGGVGVQSANIDAQSDIEVDDLDTAGFSSSEFVTDSIIGDLGESGFRGVLEAGFDWQFHDSLLVGIAGDYSFGDISGSQKSTECGDTSSDTCFRIEHGVEMQDSISITGRVGHIYENTLFYGLIGYTATNFKQTGRFDACEDDLDCLTDGSDVFTRKWSRSGWEDGLTVGAGLESRIADNITTKFEYRYTNYDTFGNSFANDPCVGGLDVGACSGSSSFDTDVHTFRTSIIYRLDSVDHAMKASATQKHDSPTHDWTGFFLGGGIGVQSMNSDAQSDIEVDGLDTFGFSSDDFVTDSIMGDLGESGFRGVLEAGFDWQFNDSFVVGIAGDYSGGNIKGSHTSTQCDDSSSDTCFRIEHGVEMQDSISVTGRVGHIYRNTLFYGLVGYTATNFEQTGRFDACEDDLDCLTDGSDVFTKSWSKSGWEDGLTLGTGVESRITDNITAKLEYRYTNYAAFGNSFDSDPCVSGVDVGECFGSSSFDTDVHAFRTSIVYRFGNSPGM